MSSFVLGPPPRPRRLPIGLSPWKKCSANLRLTMATVGSSLTSAASKSRPCEDGNVHGLEVARRQRVHERLHVLAVLRLVTLHRHRAVPLVAAQERHGGHARRPDAWRGPQAVEQVAVELHGPGVVVPAERGRQLERDQVVEVDPRVGRLQVLEAPHEQARSEQQQEAERHLRGHQALAQEERPSGPRQWTRPCPSASSRGRAGWRRARAAGRTPRRSPGSTGT